MSLTKLMLALTQISCGSGRWITAIAQLHLEHHPCSASFFVRSKDTVKDSLACTLGLVFKCRDGLPLIVPIATFANPVICYGPLPSAQKQILIRLDMRNTARG